MYYVKVWAVAEEPQKETNKEYPFINQKNKVNVKHLTV